MEIRWRLPLFLCGVFLAFTTMAQELAFTAPDISALSTDYRGWHYVMEGQDLTISWTTPFENTTLLVFEGQDNGTWTWGILALEYPSWNTTYIWKAANMNDADMGNKIYFSVQKSNDITCDGCVVKTQAFYVTDTRPIMSGSASPSVSVVRSSTAAAAPVQTVASQTTANENNAPSTSSSTQTTGAAAAGQQTSSPTPEKESSSNAIGLGVGLGVGLAVLIALIVLLFVCLRKGRRKRQPSFIYHPTGSGNWTQSDDSPQPEVREVAPKYSSGLTEETAVGSLASPKFRESDSSHASNPFCPTTPASAMSRKSFIEPFDFERPESRAQDAMSQLRQSTLIGDFDSAPPIPATGPAPASATAATAAAAAPAATLAPPTVDDDAASSNYSMQEETFGPESPSDAAVVRSPSSAIGPFSPQYDANFKYAGVGPSSSPFRPDLQRPQQAYAYPSSRADGLN